MNIAFTVNHLGLEGLGATLTSLIRNCSNSEEIKIWFFCSDFKKDDEVNINTLLESEKFKGKAKYIYFDAYKIFGHLKSLHGDWTSYGRLLIPQYIQDECALYLDADLIILLDILNLKNFDEHILAAVHASEVEYALENSFFIEKLNWLPETSYFNAGVLFLNLKKWIELDIDSKLENLGRIYPEELLSVDQTLLNAICEGKFAQLPSIYNNPWYPKEEEPILASKSILHFVGSPKPWDLFGNILHTGYNTWNNYNTKLWKIKYSKLTIKKLRRTWKIKKSILRYFLMKNEKNPYNNTSDISNV